MAVLEVLHLSQVPLVRGLDCDDSPGLPQWIVNPSLAMGLYGALSRIHSDLGAVGAGIVAGNLGRARIPCARAFLDRRARGGQPVVAEIQLFHSVGRSVEGRRHRQGPAGGRDMALHALICRHAVGSAGRTASLAGIAGIPRVVACCLQGGLLGSVRQEPILSLPSQLTRSLMSSRSPVTVCWVDGTPFNFRHLAVTLHSPFGVSNQNWVPGAGQ